MTDILANYTEHNLSIVATLYASERHIVRRTFYLRNLNGESLDSQTEHANEIANSVAQEIYHVTCVGVDKVVVRTGQKKVGEFVFDMTPHRDVPFFFYHAVKFEFTAFRYMWAKEGEQPKWSISEAAIGAGWQRIAMNTQKAKSFLLPIIVRNSSTDDLEQDQPFFQLNQIITKRRSRRRKAIGWTLSFNNEDPVYESFLSRFYMDGNLSFGRDRVIAGNNEFSQLMGVKHPIPKTKSKAAPSKSRLASQPTDDTDYVYIIQLGRKNIFKIGKSNDPQARLTSPQTSSPYKLNLFHVFTADNASAAEESLHEAFHDARMEGEWFSLTNVQKSKLAGITRFEGGKFVFGEKHVTSKEMSDGTP